MLMGEVVTEDLAAMDEASSSDDADSSLLLAEASSTSV